jgi:hypothetical protein
VAVGKRKSEGGQHAVFSRYCFSVVEKPDTLAGLGKTFEKETKGKGDTTLFF